MVRFPLYLGVCLFLHADPTPRAAALSFEPVTPYPVQASLALLPIAGHASMQMTGLATRRSGRGRASGPAAAYAFIIEGECAWSDPEEAFSRDAGPAVLFGGGMGYEEQTASCGLVFDDYLYRYVDGDRLRTVVFGAEEPPDDEELEGAAWMPEALASVALLLLGVLIVLLRRRLSREAAWRLAGR
jgi:hypothetical protein